MSTESAREEAMYRDIAERCDRLRIAHSAVVANLEQVEKLLEALPQSYWHEGLLREISAAITLLETVQRESEQIRAWDPGYVPF